MAVMLAVAYGSNIGGIGTKIGTAPNAQLSGFAEKIGIDISFLQFAAVGFPFVGMFLPVAGGGLGGVGRREGLAGDLGSAVLQRELAALGPVRAGERAVTAVFLVA